MESDGCQYLTKSQKEFASQIVTCDPQALRPHPSYARHGLAVPADKLSALRTRGELAFSESLTVTRDWIIIDGYARWALANQLKRRILHCVEYDLSENEALEWLLQRHCRSNGLNDYSRIMLAWDLEPALVEKARANRQRGGRDKGWSNVTTAEQVHVRSEIAKAAVVSTGNVTKVKQLNETCAPELIAALRYEPLLQRFRFVEGNWKTHSCVKQYLIIRVVSEIAAKIFPSIRSFPRIAWLKPASRI